MTLDTRELEDRITELEDEAEEGLDEADQNELDELLGMRDEISEWHYGETLIAEEDFEDYARELAEGTGTVSREVIDSWPFTCIDWKEAAEQLQQDYTTVEYKGTTYYYRST